MALTRRAKHFFNASFLLVSLCLLAQAQSLDINAPAPVTASELAGKIQARDIGDARFTDHYFAFDANQGDLVITIESKNLNGDVDVFTTVGLRPLMKFTLYAESSTPVVKAVFLRKRESLLMRVQARSPNDDEGTYQIKFGGSFEALPAPAVAETGTPTEDSTVARSSDKTVRRVTSAGARIYQPEPEPTPAEVAAAPTPEPSPEASPEPTLIETPSSTEKAAEAPKENTRTSGTRRSGRRGGRTRPPAETARTAESPATTTPPTTEQPPGETTATAPAPRSPSRRGSARRTPPKTETEPAPQEEDVGPRLIIETQDGTLINRSMTTVRRVMVENGQVLVVGKDGVTLRVRLTDVVKMTITPQQ